MRVLVPDQTEKIPTPIRKHDPMNLGVVLDGPEELVKGVTGLPTGQCGERSLGQLQVLAAHRIAQCRAVGWRLCSRVEADRPKSLRLATADVLNPLVVPISGIVARLDVETTVGGDGPAC